jgi:hypothetical protein
MSSNGGADGLHAWHLFSCDLTGRAMKQITTSGFITLHLGTQACSGSDVYFVGEPAPGEGGLHYGYEALVDLDQKTGKLRLMPCPLKDPGFPSVLPGRSFAIIEAGPSGAGRLYQYDLQTGKYHSLAGEEGLLMQPVQVRPGGGVLFLRQTATGLQIDSLEGGVGRRIFVLR